MAFRYIGSKARVVEAIIRRVGDPDGGRFIDAFCGTGAVADAAARAGWSVHVNDHLRSAGVIALARLTSSKQAPFHYFGGYERAIAALNAAHGQEGFMWREYSPASLPRVGVARLYFTEGNARRIDGICDGVDGFGGGAESRTSAKSALADACWPSHAADRSSIALRHV